MGYARLCKMFIDDSFDENRYQFDSDYEMELYRKLKSLNLDNTEEDFIIELIEQRRQKYNYRYLDEITEQLFLSDTITKDHGAVFNINYDDVRIKKLSSYIPERSWEWLEISCKFGVYFKSDINKIYEYKGIFLYSYTGYSDGIIIKHIDAA